MSAKETGGVATQSGAVQSALFPEFESARLAASKLSQGRMTISDLELTPTAIPAEIQSLKAKWMQDSPADVYKVCRRAWKKYSFVRRVIGIKTDLFNDGFAFQGEAGRAFEENAETQQGYDFNRVMRDIWQEYLICNNAVACFEDASGVRLPAVTVLDTELVEYKDWGSEEQIKLLFALKKKNDVNESLATTLADKDWRPLDKEGDEWHFRVLSGGKGGKGFGVPDLFSLFFDLAVFELLQSADWQGAKRHRDIMRKVSKGHAITAGPLAGQPTFFLKKSDITTIKNSLKDKLGSFDFVTNFDVEIEHVFLDPKFFDREKYSATMGRIREWAGPVMQVMASQTQDVTTFLRDLLEAEGKAARRAVGKFAEIQIFNNPLWRKGGGERLKVTFSPFTFYSAKQLLEFLNWSLSNGLMSPQTAREALCLDVEMESKRLIEAAAKPEGFRPVFEAKQGMMSGGDGRPPAEGSV